MKNLNTLLFIIGIGATVFGQREQIDRNNNEIRSILTNWDALRGDWLASSLAAMSQNRPAPVRIFRETLTATQLFAFVPVPQRDSVETLLEENEELRRRNNPDIALIGLDIARLIITANRRGTTVSGFIFGEPHIIDFDNNHRLMNSVGEFVLVKSNSSFEVQARFEKLNQIASFVTATSINVGGDIVSIYANEKPDNKSFSALRVNGDAETVSIEGLILPMGGVITYENKQYRINSPSGESAIVEIKPYENAKFLNVSFEIRTEDRSEFDGLSANQNSEHRLTEDQTLFNYSAEKDFHHYANLKALAPQRRNLNDAQKRSAEEQCSTAGVKEAEMEGCIYDLAHFGIAPSPRPIFTFPSEELTLNQVIVKDTETRNQQAKVSVFDNSNETKSKPRREANPELRREIFRALGRIALEIAMNPRTGGSSFGR